MLETRLDTKAVRAKLKPQPKPYWRSIETGLRIGYRKSATASCAWVACWGTNASSHQTRTIGREDDNTIPTGASCRPRWSPERAAANSVGRSCHLRIKVEGPAAAHDDLVAEGGSARGKPAHPDQPGSGSIVAMRATAVSGNKAAIVHHGYEHKKLPSEMAGQHRETIEK